MSTFHGTPKKRKLEADQGPLKDTVRSSLVLEDEEKWRGKELLLIQLPNNVSISQLNGKDVSLDSNSASTVKLEGGDAGKSSKRMKYVVDVQPLGEKSQTSLLVPTSKPGRLKPGPPLSKCLCLQQLVEVPPVVLPSHRGEDECKVDMPTGLKQRWKPFGHKKPMMQDKPAAVKSKSKHKAKKKSRKHGQEHR